MSDDFPDPDDGWDFPGPGLDDPDPPDWNEEDRDVDELFDSGADEPVFLDDQRAGSVIDVGDGTDEPPDRRQPGQDNGRVGRDGNGQSPADGIVTVREAGRDTKHDRDAARERSIRTGQSAFGQAPTPNPSSPAPGAGGGESLGEALNRAAGDVRPRSNISQRELEVVRRYAKHGRWHAESPDDTKPKGYQENVFGHPRLVKAPDFRNAELEVSMYKVNFNTAGDAILMLKVSHSYMAEAVKFLSAYGLSIHITAERIVDGARGT